jgi:hypothetical protein
MNEPTKKKLPPSEPAPSEPVTATLKCGIVMPISALDGCSEAHWAEVLDIISASIEKAGFEPSLVSHTDEVAFIHKTIVQNLYDNPIVVCDVSGKNSNVMFELGLRLAFDKATIVIKDDKTSYSFDTSPVEHLEYPRDLRFARIVDFQERLTQKIKATHEKATNDPNYSTFLKHFGDFTTPKLDKKEVSGQEYIISQLNSLGEAVRQLSAARVRAASPGPTISASRNRTHLTVLVPTEALGSARERLLRVPGITDVINSGMPGTAGNTLAMIEVDPDTCDMSTIKRALLELKEDARTISAL